MVGIQEVRINTPVCLIVARDFMTLIGRRDSCDVPINSVATSKATCFGKHLVYFLHVLGQSPTPVLFER